MDIIIHKHNATFMRIEAAPAICKELSDKFCFFANNYQFSPLFKAHKWDGRIRLFNMRYGTIYLGLLKDVIAFCEEHKYSYKIMEELSQQVLANKDITDEDIQAFISSLVLCGNDGKAIHPYDYQLKGTIEAIRRQKCLLLSATSSGKSLMIYLICLFVLLELQKKHILIIVPTVSLVEQLANDFADYGQRDQVFKDNIIVQKIYGKNEKKITGNIAIANWQAIAKQEADYFEIFDMVLVDEVHTAEATVLKKIVESCINAEIRIGTTGTLRESKSSEKTLIGLFGSVVNVISTKTMIDNDYSAKLDIKAIILEWLSPKSKMDYQDEIDFIASNEERTKFVAELATSRKGNTLVLYTLIEKHGQLLYDEIVKQRGDGRLVFFLNGSNSDVEERETIRQLAEKESGIIIVASYGIYSTGISIKNLHNIIFASPYKSKLKVMQSIGRGLRKLGTKVATVYDIADRVGDHEYLLNHFRERLRLYNQDKLPYEIYEDKKQLTQS